MDKFTGSDDLREWLISQGFRIDLNSLKSEVNLCNWYAYRHSDIPARACECNSDKPGMQIVVKPFYWKMEGVVHASTEIELTGEYAETWYNLRAYGVGQDEIKEKLPGIEKSLIAAWSALSYE